MKYLIGITIGVSIVFLVQGFAKLLTLLKNKLKRKPVNQKTYIPFYENKRLLNKLLRKD